LGKIRYLLSNVHKKNSLLGMTFAEVLVNGAYPFEDHRSYFRLELKQKVSPRKRKKGWDRGKKIWARKNAFHFSARSDAKGQKKGKNRKLEREVPGKILTWRASHRRVTQGGGGGYSGRVGVVGGMGGGNFPHLWRETSGTEKKRLVKRDHEQRISTFAAMLSPALGGILMGRIRSRDYTQTPERSTQKRIVACPERNRLTC